MDTSINIFGVRHLSPASAQHLLTYLNEIKPKCVLIEGPSDFNDMIHHIANPSVKPPIALLAYTTSSPIRTVLYPLANYSPEYQGICWAFKNSAKVQFIDLPTSATIDAKHINLESVDSEQEQENPYYQAQRAFYQNTTQLANEPDYETFWERHFEHCPSLAEFREKIANLSSTMRHCLAPLQWENEKYSAALNHTRESYMKWQIENALQTYAPNEIVVVTGAYHIDGINSHHILPMTKQEQSTLPKADIKTTLMPYSYYKLSTKAGYGAGNTAPAYFNLMWECIQQGDMERLAPLYLSSIGEAAREAGNYNSTANVIEGVRLANSLCALRNSPYPTLKDLQDAAVCLLGGGELSAVAEHIARVNIGTEIGALPDGVSQTPVQEDMTRQLKQLKLEKYKTVVAQDLALDLREKRNVKSQDAAFMDLNRSIFFNRLGLLNISFAIFKGEGASSWGEAWVLRWTPENEIEIVEANFKGETIETAAAFVLKEKFETAGNILEMAQLLRQAYICNLLAETQNGIDRLQEICVDSESFTDVGLTALTLSNLIQFRDVRGIDTQGIVPILQQVFLRATLVAFDGASCNDAAAEHFIKAVEAMHTVSQTQHEHIDDTLWIQTLRRIADADDRNAKVSGMATAMLMERNEITEAELKASLSRRLSYGVPGDVAAQWFEGLSGRNRYVLLSRNNIWQHLDDYLAGLDEDEFKRSLVFLRRALGTFEARQKATIVDILGDLWGTNESQLGEYLQGELTEAEQDALDSLNDFDF